VPDADRQGPSWTTEGDSRVTRIGRVLRRTAMDELPGVISIWKGDMSLVGPRALDVEEQRGLEQQIPGFEQRLRIRPHKRCLLYPRPVSHGAGPNAQIRYSIPREPTVLCPAKGSCE